MVSKNHCPFIFERTRQAEMFWLRFGLKEHLTILRIQRNRNKSPCRTAHSKAVVYALGQRMTSEELGSLDLGQPWRLCVENGLCSCVSVT